MKRTNMIKKYIIFSLCFYSLSINAAILQIDPSGQLVGASDIVANNLLYSVRFANGSSGNVRGTTIANKGYFDPGNGADANNLSSALFDQVFLDLFALPPTDYRFDTNARLTSGCPDIFTCYVLTPYADDTTDIFVSMATNTSGADFVDLMQFPLTDNISFIPYVWAQWDVTGNNPDQARDGIEFVDFDPCHGVFGCVAAVPEPNSISLILIGILGFMVSSNGITRHIKSDRFKRGLFMRECSEAK